MLQRGVDACTCIGYGDGEVTPLVTTIDDGPEPTQPRPATAQAQQQPAQQAAPPSVDNPTIVILFNERTGPGQVAEIIGNKHAFTETEIWETVDEQDRPAWLLIVACETATADQLFDLIGSRLPDYIQPRRFPPSRMAYVRQHGSRVG